MTRRLLVTTIAALMLACVLPVPSPLADAIGAEPSPKQEDDATPHWPQFRGPAASGVSTGPATPVEWDVENGANVKWKTPLPGLGHSAPAIWGDRLFVTTAVIEGRDQPLKAGLYGDIEPVKEDAEVSYNVLCLDKNTGKVLWEHTAHRGVPEVKRHPKSSHANPTCAVDGKRVIASFGSEGLYCYDLGGKPIWQKDFGLLDSAYFAAPDAQWGFASSPVLHEDTVIVQADVLKDSFLAVLDAADGNELWRTPRKDVPTWSTPTVYRDASGRTQILCNGFKEMAGYDFQTGKQVWTLGGGGDIPVPTPVVAHGLIFVTGAHGFLSPIYAIETAAEGDLTPGRGSGTRHIVWSTPRGGNYMQTPIVVGDHLYACRDNGVLTCFDAKTGKEIYRQRLEGLGFTASPVASADRLYFTSEDGQVVVVQAGPEFKLLATNPLGANCLSTPAISEGILFFRTEQYLVAIKSQ